MRARKDLLQISFNCPHEEFFKIMHHNDYDDPWDVWLLCRKCHGIVHKTMRILGFSQHKGHEEYLTKAE